LAVAPRTVQRHARRLGVWRNEWTTWNQVAPAQKRKRDTLNRRGRYRSRWLSLQKEHPEDGITALRRRAPAIYAFLYRSDRQWLKTHNPSSKISHAQHSRIDWAERDAELLVQAQSVAEEIREASGRPVRIQRTTVLRRLGAISLYFQNVNKLPRTAEFLATATESRSDFSKRKIWWAAEQFINDGTVPERWQLVRRSALRPDLAKSLDYTLDSALNFIKDNYQGAGSP
jgi:hypothetical protein